MKQKPNQQNASLAVERTASAQYLVAQQPDADTLARQVNLLVGAGWKVSGGVAVGEYLDPISRRRVIGFHQAMVRV